MRAALAALLLAALPFVHLSADAIARGLAVAHAPVPDPVLRDRIELGRRLFYDGDLSLDGSLACAGCHVQRHGFADSTRTHPGVTGEAGRRNVPGLANVGRRASLTWGDADVRTLEAQALIPMLGTHPVEMAMGGHEAELARRLSTSGCYVRLFRAAFPATGGRIDLASVTGALAAFERSLVSTEASIDRFRAGDADALTPQARAGLAPFRRHCAACHAGPDMTDDRFHAVARDAPGAADRGLGAVTGRAADMDAFRTPALRNVARTAPYFHDGASPTLADAIGRHRDVTLAPDEVAALVALLADFTDERFLGDPRFAYPETPCGPGA